MSGFRRTTPGELAGIAQFREWAVNVTRWAAEASAALPGGFNIRVGAINFDQEQLCECGLTVVAFWTNERLLDL